MDEALYQQTADIALNYEVVTEEPDAGAWRNDLVEAAVAELMEEYPDLDLQGEDWEAAEVEITPNGE